MPTATGRRHRPLGRRHRAVSLDYVSVLLSDRRHNNAVGIGGYADGPGAAVGVVFRLTATDGAVKLLAGQEATRGRALP